jgi:hypothetical protein
MIFMIVKKCVMPKFFKIGKCNNLFFSHDSTMIQNTTQCTHSFYEIKMGVTDLIFKSYNYVKRQRKSD